MNEDDLNAAIVAADEAIARIKQEPDGVRERAFTLLLEYIIEKEVSTRNVFSILGLIEHRFEIRTLTANREDANSHLRGLTENEDDELTDEEWSLVHPYIELGDEGMMESLWAAIDYALERALPKERLQP